MAKALGLSPTTVMADIKSSAGYLPDQDGMIQVGKVMGLDGKVRPSRRSDTSARDVLIREMSAAGCSTRTIAASVGCSVGTVHRIVVAARPRVGDQSLE